jgi:hypothetical protein
LKLYFDPEKKYEQKYLAMYNTFTFPAGFSDVTIISWISLIIPDPWKYIYCCLKSYPTFCGLNTVLSTDMTTQPTQYNTAYLKLITSCAMFQSIPWSFQETAHINILMLPRTARDDTQILMFR